jgi:hypothetical protein
MAAVKLFKAPTASTVETKTFTKWAKNQQILYEMLVKNFFPKGKGIP